MRDVPLTPPNRGTLWLSLALTKSQLAQLCGLTTRQVSHWTSQGYITPARHGPERYNGDAIDLCVLIKQGLQNGLPLRRAVRLAREFVAGELADQPSMSAIVPPSLLDIHDKLMIAQSAVLTVLQVVEPLVPEYPELAPLSNGVVADVEPADGDE